LIFMTLSFMLQNDMTCTNALANARRDRQYLLFDRGTSINEERNRFAVYRKLTVIISGVD